MLVTQILSRMNISTITNVYQVSIRDVLLSSLRVTLKDDYEPARPESKVSPSLSNKTTPSYPWTHLYLLPIE